jgi:hypothetical protein
MSAIKIIRALLIADAPLIALVPASRVVAGLPAQGAALSLIALTEVSRVDHNLVKGAATTRCTARVQVTVMAATYSAQKNLLAAVRHAARDKAGALSGFANTSVQLDGTGPDFMDAEAGIYQQGQDFKVSFTEPT